MAKIGDLPVELVDFITDHLRRVSDLAALARASHKFYDVVDPILYKFAKENVPKHVAWHPLRWSAENGQTGTLKKALAAGIDVNMAFVSTTFMAARDFEGFQTRVEAIDGKEVCDAPRLEPNHEWEPHEDDTDDDDLPTSISTVDRMRPGYSPPPRRFVDILDFPDIDDGEDGWNGVDDFDPAMDGFDEEAEADFMEHFHDHFVGGFWSDDPTDDDDEDDFDEDVDEDESGHEDGFGRHPDTEDDPRGSFRALHLAARGGHDNVVGILIDHGASIDVCSRQLCKYLCKHILDRGFVELDAVDHSGLTPFYYAYRCGQWSSTVSFLLEKGAHINFLVRQPTRHNGVEGGEFFTTLYEACVFGCYAEAIKLINLGADVNGGRYALNVQYSWPLHAVCGPPRPFHQLLRNPAMRNASASAQNDEEQRVELIKLMLRSGADIEAKTCYELDSPLQYAAMHCDVAVLQVLLAEGADVESQNDQKQERIVRILLQRGAKDTASNGLGITPFESAFRGGLLGVCDILVRRRQSPQPWRHEDFDRMMLATIRDRPHDLDAVDLLLDLDINGTLFSKSTYLMMMIDGGHVKMASRYLERGPARLPLNPKEKLTILQEGLARSNEAIVKQMLAVKVSVNFPDKNGHTPLYVVLQGGLPGKEELVKALLKAGADAHFRPPSSTDIMTPLEKAVMLQQHALVDIMLGAQPLRNNPKAPKGVYLHAAARTVPSKRMFSTLIRSGASVTELDSNGDTPLSVFLKSVADQPHWTAHTRGAAKQVCATVWYLWNKKVDINLRNKSGKAITSYLTALRLYTGDNQARKRIADELQLCVEIVPAEGADGEKGLKMLRFRHGLMGLGTIGGHGAGGGTKPPIRL
ncbi:hypothetical protein SLS63_004411 [Diaporthe eres]|uniref:Ankyrin repeat protein n=1 Tax=Diaporthe eres TaxID=83184 RepID=A0ABR1PE98_DIAER